MKLIGLTLCEHDANITFVNNDEITYYKSERDLQIKHHNYNSLYQWIPLLRRWNTKPEEIDAIAVVIDLHTWKNLKGDESKLWELFDIPQYLDLGFSCPIFRINHHWAHKLSMWMMTEKTDIDFILDGFGDDFRSRTVFREDEIIDTATIFDAESIGRALSKLKSLFSNKISQRTKGLDVAGKLMALQSFGKKESIISERMDKYGIDDIFPLSHPDNWSIENKLNWLHCLHKRYEAIFVDFFSQKASSNEVIGYSGGIAQNTVINAKLKNKFPELLIPPHCADDGLSLGCVEFLRRHFKLNKFKKENFPYWQDDESPNCKPTTETIQYIANKLNEGAIVAWYQGNGEIGPRALGNRSILMNPMLPNGKDIINFKVKRREQYRPFGASILEEDVSKIFKWEGQSPYMLYIMDLLEPRKYPSITHIDGTCRTQTVNENQNPLFYQLLKNFKAVSGVGMLLNTSLNIAGKPIAGKFLDAYELYQNTALDILVFGNKVFEKQKSKEKT